MKPIVILDAEYIFWDGGNNPSRSLIGTPTEVIQIAALKVDPENFKVIDSFSSYVKPKMNNKIPKRIAKLTGIVQRELRKSQNINTVGKRLKEFVADSLVISYGVDPGILNINSVMFKPRGEILIKYWRDLAEILSKQGFPTNQFSSGTLFSYPQRGVKTEIHDAIEDVESIRRFLRAGTQDKSLKAIFKELSFDKSEQQSFTIFILTPVYATRENHGYRKVLQAIDSARRQRHECEIVHLIVDDGSTDQRVQKYFSTFKSESKLYKIIYERKDNGGVLSSLNELSKILAEHAGENDYVLRLNSDDLLSSTILSQIENRIATHSPDILYSPSVVFNSSDKSLDLVDPPIFESQEASWRHLLNHQPFPHLNICWKAEIYSRLFKFLDVKTIPYSEDWFQAVETFNEAKKEKLKIEKLSMPGYYFRKENVSLGRKQLMDLKGKIKSIINILRSQTSGALFYYRFVLEMIRLARIRTGIEFEEKYRKFIMPKYGRPIDAELLDENDMKMLNKARTV